VTVSATGSTSVIQMATTTALTVLAEVSSSAAQLANNREMTLISNQIQKQLNAKVAALQPPADTALATAAQAQITALQNQRSAINAISTTSGSNANILSDLQTQLGALQTAAGNGDSAGFDAALAAANTEIFDLTATAPPAPFQSDRVASLKGNGLGIGNSAAYDLSTPAGQAAAAQDVSSAQDLVGLIFQTTTSNQILATGLMAALSTRINTLTSQQQQSQQSEQLQVTTQILQLTQQAQNQTHLIELALGGTSTLANELRAAATPPQPFTSVFQALQSAVGAVAGPSQQTAPAILSLLA
jgi:hypothetical protein